MAEKLVRNNAILDEVMAGKSCAAVGSAYGITAPRVRMICFDVCLQRNKAAWQADAGSWSIPWLRANRNLFPALPADQLRDKPPKPPESTAPPDWLIEYKKSSNLEGDRNG